MEAVILAGGVGTRLQSVVRDVPKPMADINGRPFLSYVMDYLSGQDIGRILLSVGYKYEVIRDYFGANYKKIDIEYIVEETPLGTGGAIREALKKVRGDNAVVLNGDTFFDVDLRKMVDFHIEHDSLLTFAVKPMHYVDRYGTVIVKEKRVIGFDEKSFKPFGYVNGGVIVIGKAISDFFECSEGAFSFEVDFLYNNVMKISSFAFICDNYFIDIGVPEDYKRAQQELKHVVKGALQ